MHSPSRKHQRHDKNSKRQQFKRHTTKHHVYPTSRFVLKKNPDLHTAWHDVFQNKTPEEAIEVVEEWARDSLKFHNEITCEPRKLNAWKMLFDKTSLVAEVIEVIKRDWVFRGFVMVRAKEYEEFLKYKELSKRT